jgi:hypothetical protein
METPESAEPTSPRDVSEYDDEDDIRGDDYEEPFSPREAPLSPRASVAEVVYCEKEGMDIEYERWRLICSIENDFRQLSKSQRLSYEALNILERWIMTCVWENEQQKILGDVVFGDGMHERASTEQCIIELCKKKLFRKQKGARIFVLQISAKIKRFLQDEVEETKASSRVSKLGDFFGVRYRQFYKRVPSKRMEAWKLRLFYNSFVGLDQAVHNSYIAHMVLRYGSMINRGQQWSLPKKVCHKLHNLLKFDLEGFASPFNAQLMNLGVPFCSAFPDTDKAFGSLGSFFDQDLANKHAYVNPPYIEVIMNCAAAKCLDACKDGDDTLFLFAVPVWTDSEYFRNLISSKWLRISKKCIFDHYSANEQCMDTKFPTQILVLSTRNFDSINRFETYLRRF